MAAPPESSRPTPRPSSPPSRGDVARCRELVDDERALALVRALAALFLASMVAVYDLERYPATVAARAYALVGLLLLVAVAAVLLARRVHAIEAARRLVLATLVFDAIILIGFVWLHAFDPRAPHFLVLFALPAEAALKYRLRGALAAWVVCVAAYLARAGYAQAVHGAPIDAASVGLRMGMLLLVAVSLGLFARRLARQADQLREVLARLEAEERWRTALIDMLAHDLRSPIGTAASALLLLQERSDDLDATQRSRLLASATRQARQALTLADDLLELARARAGQIDLRRQEVDLDEAIARAIAELSEDGDWARVEVVGTGPALLDHSRVHQILVNLLSNARKHGRPPVLVHADVRPDRTRVRVSDHGRGLAEEHLATAFEPLASAPRTDSVGLGLWIVRTLARAHGGEATYGVLEGLPTFEVTLPHHPTPA